MANIVRRRSWEIPSSRVTPEEIFRDRRRILKAMGFGAAAALAARTGTALAAGEDPSAGLYPAQRNAAYVAPGTVTPETITGGYNNFFEFGSHKGIARAAQRLRLRPWQISIEGMVEEPMTIDIDDLLKRVALEERVYRLRCVEAWSLIVPWTGFPLSKLLEIARPLSSARYVRFETFHDPQQASGQLQVWCPWPYVEGVTMAEAANELAFLVTGAYGKPLAAQNGAPIRLILPWKYGFKSIKSIRRITFTDERPVSFWETIAGDEYGFWANVNPDVAHPRWSQAEEREMATGNTIPTQLFNGYGEQVAHLYAGIEGEQLYR